MAFVVYVESKQQPWKKMGIEHKLLRFSAREPFAFASIAILWLPIDFFSEQCTRCTLYLSVESGTKIITPPLRIFDCLFIRLDITQFCLLNNSRDKYEKSRDSFRKYMLYGNNVHASKLNFTPDFILAISYCYRSCCQVIDKRKFFFWRGIL